MPDPSIEFRIELDDEWLPVRDVDPQAFIRHFGKMPGLSCCSFQAGFFITIGGEPWNDEETVDEFGNAKTWIGAIEAILLHDRESWVSVWAWEESDCRIRRQGQELLLEDKYSSGSAACPRVTTSFRSFAKQLLAESRAWQVFAARLLAALDRVDVTEYPQENLAVLAREVSVPEFRQRLDRLEALIDEIPEDL